ncbi:CD63 antigen-like [Sitodiplosis mosellana]|uniref:CD63 antigen-like n=1 Tax=Sitodiplosis mosellana TaxID=263140 RepID=UPI002444C396|nr:CD63 antigen-like [Sitodiplosis mosellana]XP_055296823.1 CD63 antigen-like [Sitodiplosis mosellana]
MVDCGVTCAKYSVFFFNLLFALTGIAILTVGTVIFTAFNHYQNFLGEGLWSTPIVLMAIGAIVFIIAFLGCCGAIKESSCMVLTFSLLLIVIIAFEIGIGAFGYVRQDDLNAALDKGFNQTLKDYKTNEKAWDLVQTEMKCCGINTPDDFIPVLNSTDLPRSCCLSLAKDKPCTKTDASKTGCKPALLKYLSSQSTILAGVAVAVGLIQIVGLGYACCLYRAFRKNYEAV